jgi:O-antigen/teichoic acid export membrane protein
MSLPGSVRDVAGRDCPPPSGGLSGFSAEQQIMITSENTDKAIFSERRSTSLRFALHPAFRDFAVTGTTSFLVGVAAMVVISILGKATGPVFVGEYLLIRRMASWFQAGVQLPSGVALPRFVAFNMDESVLIRQTYFLGALLTSCLIALLLGIILLFWRNPLSHLFFGSAQFDHLVLPLCLLLLGLAIHGVVFGYYQGTLSMVWASALQLCNLVLVPVFATLFLKSRHSIPLIVNTMGILMCACSCLFAWPLVRQWELGGTLTQLKRQSSELLSYGSARIFGDVGLQAMLSLPAVVAAHYFPISSVSFLLLGGSFLAVVGAASLPLATILLSRVSRSIAQLRTDQLRIHVTHFVNALIELSVFVCLQMVAFSDVIVRAWVGPSFLVGIRIIRITILAVPFYFVYAGLRSIIDAAAVKAYNTRNIVISGGIFLLSIPLIKLCVPPGYLLEGLAASGVLGLVVLTVCTLRTIQQLIRIDLEWVRLLPGLCIAAMFGALSLSFHRWNHYELGLAALSLFEFFLAGLYLLIMWTLRSPWVRFLLSKMFLTLPLEIINR